MKTIAHFFKKTHDKIKHFRSTVSAMKKKEDEALRETVVPEEIKPAKMEISVSGATMAKFVAITLLLLIAACFVYYIRDIIVLFFVALLFAAALDPMVDALERRKIPRAAGVILIYIFVLLILGLLIGNLVPVVAGEVSKLAGSIQDFISNIVSGKIELPRWLEGVRPTIQRLFEGINLSKIANYKDFLLQVANRLSDVAGNVFNAVLLIFNGFFNSIIVLVITFMMTVDEAGMDKFILSLFPVRHADYIRRKSNLLKEKMGYWLRGQVALCVIVGVLVYVGFLVIGLFTKKVEYAATIALVAGFTELIPYIGPFLAWIVALPIMANQSLMMIVWMTILMYIVQVLENNFIVPFVMNKAVGISPIFIMFAMFVGFSFLGVLGIVLSVPVATAVAIFVKDYTDKEK